MKAPEVKSQTAALPPVIVLSHAQSARIVQALSNALASPTRDDGTSKEDFRSGTES